MDNLTVGFTGTQKGMTPDQYEGVSYMLRRLTQLNLALSTEVHHGDCIGADFEMHGIAYHAGALVVVHPPESEEKRAHADLVSRWRTSSTVVLEPKPYIVRNHDIVDACNFLIAAPSGDQQRRSGTWATIRYALKKDRWTYIVKPSGVITTVEFREIGR